MKKLKLLLLASAFFSLQQCAIFTHSIDKSELNLSKRYELEGKYEILPLERIDPLPVHYDAKNLLHLSENKCFSKRTKLNESTQSYAEIKFINPKQLKLQIFEEENLIYEKVYQAKMIRKGYLKLGRQLRILGIPYIMGTHSLSQTRISLDKEHNLIWNVSQFHGGGAFIIVFLNWSDVEQHFVFRKIN